MSLADRKWLACLTDSEGSIHIGKIKETRIVRGYMLVPMIAYSNSCKAFLEEAQRILGIGYLSLTKDKRPAKRKDFRWKDKYMLLISAEYIRQILPQLEPYLIVKKKQAEVMMEFLQLFEQPPRKLYSDKPEHVKKRAPLNFKTCKKLAEQGWSKTRIAREYGVHITTVSKCLSTEGFTTRRVFRGEYPPEVIILYEKLKRLNMKGQPIQENG